MLHPAVYPSIGPFYLTTNTPTYNPSYHESTFNPSPLPTFEPSDTPTVPPIPANVPSPDPSSLYPTLKIRPSVLDPNAPTYNPFYVGPTFNQSPFPTLESTDIPTLHSNPAGVSSPKTSSWHPTSSASTSSFVFTTINPSYNPDRSSRPTSSAPIVSSSTSRPRQHITSFPQFEEKGEDITLIPTLKPTALTIMNTPFPIRFPIDADNHIYSEHFVTECFSYLLSPELTSDDLISQNDFTEFITHHCIQTEICEEGRVITFEELDISLQIAFILGVCSVDDEDSRMSCLDDLRVTWNSGNNFGLDADVEDINMLIWNLCAYSYGHLLEMGLTTSKGD